jgi:4-amino-4-deoxy-L-arabinose transferase-like glycosyltransferase
LTLQLTPRRAALLFVAALLFALYFFDLSGMGLISKDEPRYADIGRGMARTGDLITPRLWGEPFFEKPPLLYWMMAAGYKAGLGPELAPRLPVALLSAAFLVFFWDRLRRIWNIEVACWSTGLLATSAGWAALSCIGITDIPLAVFFSVAVLLAIEETPKRRLTLAAASLGLAVLAKSLVGPVLFLPVLAVDRRRISEWLRPGPLIAFFAVALPWHILCFAKNGWHFVYVLFTQQQFGRFTSNERAHGQPWWFYGPALLLALYPWFPLLGAASREWRDRRIRILLAVVIFGFLFFSKSPNKLPTYLLPLIPSCCVLIGVGMARLAKPERAMVIPLALLGMIPVASGALPTAIATGIHTVPIPWKEIAVTCAAFAGAGAILAILLKNKMVIAAFAFTAAGFLWLKAASFPALDRAATARPLWRSQHPDCTDSSNRGMAYGLNYYAGRLLPQCDVLDQSPTRVVR